jgi:hypothetical protein
VTEENRDMVEITRESAKSEREGLKKELGESLLPLAMWGAGNACLSPPPFSVLYPAMVKEILAKTSKERWWGLRERSGAGASSDG